MNLTDKPLAAHGFTSYRYRGTFGWIMIGATDDADALREAARSLSYTREAPDIACLQVWNGTVYVDVAKAEGK